MKEFTREQACFRLKCSSMTLRRFEAAGRLRTRREKINGVGSKVRVWINGEDLERLAKEWRPGQHNKRGIERVDSKLVECNVRGKIAARVFPMFRAGASLHDIVLATESDPLLIRQLYAEWKTSLLGAEERQKLAQQEADDRARQKQHDIEKRQAEFREWKLRLAQIEADAKVRAASAAAEAAERAKAMYNRNRTGGT